MEDIFSNEIITNMSNEFNIDYNSFSVFINDDNRLVISQP